MRRLVIHRPVWAALSSRYRGCGFCGCGWGRGMPIIIIIVLLVCQQAIPSFEASSVVVVIFMSACFLYTISIYMYIISAYIIIHDSDRYSINSRVYLLYRTTTTRYYNRWWCTSSSSLFLILSAWLVDFSSMKTSKFQSVLNQIDRRR